MKPLKLLIRLLLLLLSIPLFYVLIAMVLSEITVSRLAPKSALPYSIYLSSNGVHMDIIIPKQNLDSLLLAGLYHRPEERYLAFGWGEENFYLHTPTWADLTLQNACNALLIPSTSLMHLTRYRYKQPHWIEVNVSKTELARLQAYLQASFALDPQGNKTTLAEGGYTSRDDFYKASGSYSGLNTCNSWVNTGFKESGLKACAWTPFDFGLMNKYR